MNKFSGDDRSTLLSFLSCGALQNDKIIIGILKVLFQYLGIGTRLALCSVNWLEAREFVILLPDSIIFEPIENKSRARRGLLCKTRISRKTVTSTADEGWLCSRGMWLVACIRDVFGGVEAVLFSSHLSFAFRASGGFCMLSL